MANAYAIVSRDNVVLNLIAWDGVSPFDYGQGEGCFTVPLAGKAGYGIGWLYDPDAQSFTDITVPPPPPVPEVPQVITPRQCRLELLNRGLLEQVEVMIAAQDQATRITWEYAVEFRRDNPLLMALATNLGLTDQQVDQFFIAAAAL